VSVAYEDRTTSVEDTIGLFDSMTNLALDARSGMFDLLVTLSVVENGTKTPISEAIIPREDPMMDLSTSEEMS
jgi:hypothetical protein